MEKQDAWLIHHKASLGQRSTMNMDGSTFVIAIGVVPAGNILEAIPKLKDYLNSDHMDILDIWKCERYLADNFAENTEENTEINEGVALSLKNGSPVLVCGISSEALDCEEDESHE